MKLFFLCDALAGRVAADVYRARDHGLRAVTLRDNETVKQSIVFDSVCVCVSGQKLIKTTDQKLLM